MLRLKAIVDGSSFSAAYFNFFPSNAESGKPFSRMHDSTDNTKTESITRAITMIATLPMIFICLPQGALRFFENGYLKITRALIISKN